MNLKEKLMKNITVTAKPMCVLTDIAHRIVSWLKELVRKPRREEVAPASEAQPVVAVPKVAAATPPPPPAVEDWPYYPGYRFRAIVKEVTPTGVFIEMPVGIGVIGTRCWGTGPDRLARMKCCKPGQEIGVIVHSSNPVTRGLSLILANGSLSGKTPQPSGKSIAKGTRPSGKSTAKEASATGKVAVRKPNFVPLPKSDLLLIDGKSLLSALPREVAAASIEIIGEWFRAQGYRATLFLDVKTALWAEGGLDKRERDVFRDYCGGRNVMLVPDWSEEKFTQAARGEADVVIVSNDFRGRKPFADAGVADPSVKTFSVAYVDGKAMVTFSGIPVCVAIPLPPERAAA